MFLGHKAVSIQALWTVYAQDMKVYESNLKTQYSPFFKLLLNNLGKESFTITLYCFCDHNKYNILANAEKYSN